MIKINYKDLAAKLFCWCVLAVLFILFFKYFFAYTVPFLISWGIACLIYPLACELSERIKLPRRICAFIMLSILLVLIITLAFLVINRLLFEVQRLLSYLTENADEIARYFEGLFDYLSNITQKLPIISNLENTGLFDSIVEKVDVFLTSIWDDLLSKLGSAVPDLAAGVVTMLPNVLFVSLITVVACFYFTLDLESIHSKLKRLVPGSIYSYAINMKDKAKYGFKKYVKAYLIIFLITFAELFVGFLILGLDYSFVLAVLIAIVDFLPVLGTGAILAPWGIILLLMKNYFLGIGILILFVVTTVVRQVVEPKIVGKSLGVHPLLTLIAIYVGFKLFGILGVLFLPLALVIAFSHVEDEEQKIEKADVN